MISELRVYFVPKNISNVAEIKFYSSYCTLKSPNSHANPTYTFVPSLKWGIFPRKGLSTKHTRKRNARNDREFSRTLGTFSEKCSLATITMNWRLTRIDFDLILNIQDTPVYCRVKWNVKKLTNTESVASF